MVSFKWKDMAERTTILRCVVGSQAYGLALDGTSDRDEKGICVEDYEDAFALHGEFEQFVFRTAVERTGDEAAKSEPGDLDLTIYSLKKALKLMMGGNPNMIELLFIRGDGTISWNGVGTALQDLSPSIVSRKAGGAYLGYMKGQRNRYFKSDGDGSRQALIEKWGYDVKAASHVIRLGFQACELLENGRLSLPIANRGWRDVILDIKMGKFDLKTVNEAVLQLEDKIKELMETSDLPEKPDYERVNSWMQEVYLSQWNLRRSFWKESPYVH